MSLFVALSIPIEIGAAIERRMKTVGMIQRPQAHRQHIAYRAGRPEVFTLAADAGTELTIAIGFSPRATLCAKCNIQALVLMDGCQICWSCGYRK